MCIYIYVLTYMSIIHVYIDYTEYFRCKHCVCVYRERKRERERETESLVQSTSDKKQWNIPCLYLSSAFPTWH